MRPHSGFPLREGKLLKPSHLSSQRLKSLAIGRPSRCFAAITAVNGANGKSDLQGSELNWCSCEGSNERVWAAARVL